MLKQGLVGVGDMLSPSLSCKLLRASMKKEQLCEITQPDSYKLSWSRWVPAYLEGKSVSLPSWPLCRGTPCLEGSTPREPSPASPGRPRFSGGRGCEGCWAAGVTLVGLSWPDLLEGLKMCLGGTGVAQDPAEGILALSPLQF